MSDWRPTTIGGTNCIGSLREKLRRSALMDIPGFTENLEAAYRTMWREWCKSQCRKTET